MSLKQIGFDDFIDMYNDLNFSPDDTWRQKLIAFYLRNSFNSIVSERRNHLVWVMNYFDCVAGELESDEALLAFAEKHNPNILNAGKVASVIRGHIQY